MIQVLSGKKGIEEAFETRFIKINVYISGVIRVVAVAQDNPEQPWKHYWHAVERKNEAYVSIFDKDDTVDKNAPQRVLQDGDIIWHENKPYVLRQQDDDWLIAPPYAILHPEWLLQLSDNKKQSIYLVEAFDAPDSSRGFYWCISSLDLIPVSPATAETLSRKEYDQWRFEKKDPRITEIHLHDCELHLERDANGQVYLQRIQDDHGMVGIYALLKIAINMYSEDVGSFGVIDSDRSLIKDYLIPSNSMELFLSYLERHYGMTLPRDKTFFTPRQLADAINNELSKRFFV